MLHYFRRLASKRLFSSRKLLISPTRALLLVLIYKNLTFVERVISLVAGSQERSSCSAAADQQAVQQRFITADQR